MPILPTWLSRQSKTSGYLLAAIVVLGMGMLFVAAAPSLATTDDQQQELEPGVVDGLQTNNISINVSFEPTSNLPGHSPGAPQTYEVVIENATEGIEGYEFNLDITNNPGVFSFADVNETAGDNLNYSNTSILNNGNSILFETALGNNTFDGADEIVIAEVGVTADPGAAPTNYPNANRTETEGWSVDVTSGPVLQDLNHTEYAIGNENYQSPPVHWIDVSGDGNPATDLTGDGKLEDVDGNEQYDLRDVGFLFDNVNHPSTNDNEPYFDYRDRGAIDLRSVGDLFDMGDMF